MLAVAALMAGAAVLVSWPLASHLGTHLPIGTELHPTVLWFNLWTMEWNADRLLHGYADYWNAPIFHPTPLSFALSEPQPLTGFVHGLLRIALAPAAAYGVLVLLILTANGLAGFRLLRAMRLPRLAAALGGLLTLALPYVLLELGVLQLAVLSPVIMCLAELRSLHECPSTAAALRLGAWIAATLFTCAYYAAFLSAFLALAAAMLVRRVHLERRFVSSLAAAGLLTAAACAPVLVTQQRALAGHTRQHESVKKGSASLRRYIQADPRSVAAVIPAFDGRPRGRNLYPGVVLCLLALAGFFAARRGPQRRWVLFCAAGLGLSLFVSFGRRLELAGFVPYELVFERFWPGFSRIRSPYRCAAFAQLFLVALAGLGLSALQQSGIRLRGRAAGPALAVLLACLAVLEVVPRGQALCAFPEAAMTRPWVDWLRAHPGGGIVMIPSAPGPSTQDYLPTTLAMLQGLGHGHPLVNGYSGFFPTRARILRGVLRTFPDRRSLEFLRDADCRYAVVDALWLKGRARSGRAWTALHTVIEDAGHTIFELGPHPGSHP